MPGSYPFGGTEDDVVVVVEFFRYGRNTPISTIHIDAPKKTDAYFAHFHVVASFLTKS